MNVFNFTMTIVDMFIFMVESNVETISLPSQLNFNFNILFEIPPFFSALLADCPTPPPWLNDNSVAGFMLTISIACTSSTISF